MPNIPFKASCHLLHKFSHIWSGCFCSVYHLHDYMEEDFCYSNNNHKSHKPFLEGTLKNHGCCERLGEPATLLEDHPELCGGLGSRAWARGTREIFWVSHRPKFLILGMEMRDIQTKPPLPKCKIWDPTLPS